VALASDLETVIASGFRVLPLHQIVDTWLRTPDALAGERIVAITCDQGADLDFHDLAPPPAGAQRSVFNILRDFGKRHPGTRATATSS